MSQVGPHQDKQNCEAEQLQLPAEAVTTETSDGLAPTGPPTIGEQDAEVAESLSQLEEEGGADTVVAPQYTSDGTKIFGPTAVLRPVPRTLVSQPNPTEHVPDIAADWLDVGLGQIRAVSARGHMHRHLGEVRQDSFAIGQRKNSVLMAVADGVGSAPSSHLGSAIAARRAVEAGDVLALATMEPAPDSMSLESIAEEISTKAADVGTEPRHLSTTLVVAIIAPSPQGGDDTVATLLQVGDSSAWRLHRGEWLELGPSAREGDSTSPISTGVQPLPDFWDARVWREELRPGDVLALMSDGVANILNANEGFSDTLADLWSTGAPAPGPLLEIVDATVKSFDDDRTFVAIRMGP